MPMINSLLDMIPAYRRLRHENEQLKSEISRRDEVMQTIESVCREAAMGNLEPRILGLHHDAAHREVARAINHLLDLTDAYVRESTVSLSAAVDGRFYRQFLERGMLGSFRLGATTINDAASDLKDKSAALEEVGKILQDMSTGDFTRHLDGSFNGAYGRLQDSLNGMSESVRAMLDQIRDASARVAVSSDEVGTTSRSLSTVTDQTSERIQSVSAASIQAGNNVQTVAAAAEELSESIREINVHLQDAARIGVEATSASTEIAELMDMLDRQSAEIDAVIGVINDFSRQTHLLALNATIEAARVGEAGRGFLVVAHEVGELANQTAVATGDITAKVHSVKDLVGKATAGIRHTTDVVQRLGEINAWVAASMGEQTLVTDDIARNVSEAAVGTDEAARGVSDVADAARSTADSATQSLAASEKLLEIASSLEQMLSRFRT